jgi:hypothetical protein
MRDADGLSASRRRVTAIIVSFTAAVFVLDLLTPLGIPYWLLFRSFLSGIIPRGILRISSQRSAPFS